MVFDGMKKQGFCQKFLVAIETLDKTGGKPQKGLIIGGKERPSTSGQGSSKPGDFEVGAEDGKVWIFTNQLICKNSEM